MSHIIFLIDTSYSMKSELSKVVNGLNSFIAKHQHTNHYITVIAFSDIRKYICVNIPIMSVQPFQESQFRTFGMTRLYDAVSQTIENFNYDGMKKHLFIISDGEDTGSKEYTKYATDSICAIAISSTGWNITHCSTEMEKLHVPNQITFDTNELDTLLSGLTI